MSFVTTSYAAGAWGNESRKDSIRRGVEEAHQGKTRPAEEVFEELGIAPKRKPSKRKVGDEVTFQISDLKRRGTITRIDKRGTMSVLSEGRTFRVLPASVLPE